MEQKTYTKKKIICTSEKEKIWVAKKIDGILEVYNKKEDELLGTIEKLRVGKFMHWCFCPNPDMFFTNGCLKEISLYITEQYQEQKLKTEVRNSSQP